MPFYPLVSSLTCEEEFAQHRQLFLTEQGYRYHIQLWDDECSQRGGGFGLMAAL